METITNIYRGIAEWAMDRDVIKRHFTLREGGTKDIEDDGSHHPMILSMWQCVCPPIERLSSTRRLRSTAAAVAHILPRIPAVAHVVPRVRCLTCRL